MSFNESKRIFEHALEIAKIKCIDLEGTDKVISRLRALKETSEIDPRVNRSLFFEPWIDAQQLNIPEQTAEAVAAQMHKLSAMTLWTRLKCPNLPSEEDGTIIETCKDAELKAVLDQCCNHCGRMHDIKSVEFESMYAPNFESGEITRDFENARLIKVNRNFDTHASESQIGRCASISGLELSPFNQLDVVLVALRKNSYLQAVPSPFSVWFTNWGGKLLIFALSLAAIIIANIFIGPFGSCLVMVFSLVFLILTLRHDIQVRLAPSAVQLTATRLGLGMALFMSTAGSTGLEFSLTNQDGIEIPIGQTKLKLPVELHWGKTNWPLVRSSMVVLLLTMVFILLYDGRIGWFSNRAV